MPRLKNGELSQTTTGYYRVTVGKEKKEDGTIRPAVFSLGKEYAPAMLKAEALRDIWAKTDYGDYSDKNPKVWDASMLEHVEFRLNALKLMAGYTAQRAEKEASELEAKAKAIRTKAQEEVVSLVGSPEPMAATQSPAQAQDGVVMLHASLDAYIEAVRLSPGASSYKDGIKDSMDAVKFYRPDCPLSSVDYLWLESLANFIKARPLSRKKNKATGKCEPISVYTVKRLLQHSRQAFQWISKAHQSPKFGGWRKPLDFEDIWAVDMNQIRTKAERDAAADGPEQITIDEIVRLYKAIDADNVTHKAIFLTALFGGQGQQELSVARWDEIDLAAATFTHRRNKTGQLGQYWLPEELVELLKAHQKLQPKNRDGLVFMTQDGFPLVTEKSDSVRQAYDDWRERVRKACKGDEKPIRDGITFYSLRRYLGHRAAMTGGSSLRDAALSHSAKTVGAKHYSNFRDFPAVFKVGIALHAELKAAGMFDAKKEEKK